MIPENPQNAIAISPAVTSTMGDPFNAGEMSLYSSFSRIPASRMMEMVNPVATAKPFTVLVRILYSFVALVSATPSTAQLVVISGS